MQGDLQSWGAGAIAASLMSLLTSYQKSPRLWVVQKAAPIVTAENGSPRALEEQVICEQVICEASLKKTTVWAHTGMSGSVGLRTPRWGLRGCRDLVGGQPFHMGHNSTSWVGWGFGRRILLYGVHLGSPQGSTIKLEKVRKGRESVWVHLHEHFWSTILLGTQSHRQTHISAPTNLTELEWFFSTSNWYWDKADSQAEVEGSKSQEPQRSLLWNCKMLLVRIGARVVSLRCHLPVKWGGPELLMEDTVSFLILWKLRYKVWPSFLCPYL